MQPPNPTHHYCGMTIRRTQGIDRVLTRRLMLLFHWVLPPIPYGFLFNVIFFFELLQKCFVLLLLRCRQMVHLPQIIGLKRAEHSPVHGAKCSVYDRDFFNCPSYHICIWEDLLPGCYPMKIRVG